MDESCQECQQMNLFECSPEYAHSLIFWSGVIVVFYLVLALTRFLPAAKSSPNKQGKFAWSGLSLIFVFCGITGYGTVILSGWYPEIAYPLKLWFMKFGAISCLFFLILSRGHLLELSKTKKIEEILDDSNEDPVDRLRKAQNILKGKEMP